MGGILGAVLGHLSGQQNQQHQQTQQRSNVGSSNTQNLINSRASPLVLAWIQKQGGIQGALDKLKGMGLSSQVDDWVSTGPGENASVDQQ